MLKTARIRGSVTNASTSGQQGQTADHLGRPHLLPASTLPLRRLKGLPLLIPTAVGSIDKDVVMGGHAVGLGAWMDHSLKQIS